MPRPSPDPLDGFGLSVRERDVFWLVAERLRNREIAERLHIGVRTVETHVSTLLRKLAVEQRDEIVALAARIARRRINGTPPPTPLSSFIGRDRESSELRSLLGRERLLTLVGPPGVGKTRLAFHAARTATEMPPAVLVDLATAMADEELLRTFTAALGLNDSDRAVRAALFDAVGAAPAWLVVDNCEHVEDAAAALLHDLLGYAPELHVLATSRSPLGVDGERVVHVDPLDLPERDSDAMDAAACRLFVDRAGQVADRSLTQASVADIAELCRRLDGLPLAIELAAAQTRWFSPAELLAQLGEQPLGLDARRSGAPDRHRTLAAAVRWSYDLLDEAERTLLERCSVFPGTFELDALIEVAGFGALSGADVVRLLPRLVDRSLVTARELPDQTTAYRLLVSIRVFAHARLVVSGDREAVDERHARCHLERAVARAAELATPRQAEALAWFDRRWRDLGQSIRWILARNDVETAWTFLAGVGRRWLIVGKRGEVLDWIERLLERPLPAGTLGAEARLTAAHLLIFKDTSRALSLAVGTEVEGLDDEQRLHALRDLTAGKALAFLHRHEEATPRLEAAAAWFRSTGDGWHEALALQALGHGGGDVDTVLTNYRRSARRFRELHDDVMLANTLTLMTTRALTVAPDMPAIDEWLAESRELADRTDSEWERAHVALNEAELLRHRGEHDRADAAFADLAATFRQLADHRCVSRCTLGLAQGAIAAGDDERAVADLRSTAELAEVSPFPLAVASALRLLAGIDERAGDPSQAARLLGRASVAAANLDGPRRDGLPDGASILARLSDRIGQDRVDELLDEGRAMAPAFPW